MDPLPNERMSRSQSEPYPPFHSQTHSASQNNNGKKIDKKLKPKAVWDPKTTETWINICMDEVKEGNKPGTHFSKTGWRNLMAKFLKITGRDYDRAQHKNRWDSLKKEWQLWQSLVRGESGLGWDPVRQTVDASDEWWLAKIEKFPEAAKFRLKGLEHKDKLDFLFSDVAAAGDHAWAPCSIVLPTHIQIDDAGDDSTSLDAPNDDLHAANVNIDVDNQSIPNKIRKRSYERSRSSGSRKGNKLFMIRKLVDTLDRFMEMMESSETQTISFDRPGCSIPEVLHLIEELPGVSRGDGIYMFATELFLRRQHREMFVAIPEPALRLSWIKRMEQRQWDGGHL